MIILTKSTKKLYVLVFLSVTKQTSKDIYYQKKRNFCQCGKSTSIFKKNSNFDDN